MSVTCVLEPKLNLNPKVILSEADLLAVAVHIDRYVIEVIDRLIEDFTGINTLTVQTFKQLSKNKHRLNDKILSENQVLDEGVSSTLESISAFNEQMEAQATTPTSRLQRLCACCESSVVFYNAVIETTTDENILSAAEELAVSADDRYSVLKQVLGKKCGCYG